MIMLLASVAGSLFLVLGLSWILGLVLECKLKSYASDFVLLMDAVYHSRSPGHRSVEVT